MATAVLSGVPTIINDAESVTGWVGDTFSLEPDIKVQGSNSVACVMTSNGTNDAWVTGTWDFSGGGLGEQHLRLWFNMTFVGNLSPTDPIQIFLSDGTNTAYYTWTKGSSYAGGWTQAVVFTGNTPTSGTVNKAAITSIGMRFNTSTKPRNVPANIWFDAWRYGEGFTVTGGTSGDELNWSHLASVDKTNAYGIVTNIDGVYFVKGSVEIGNGVSTTYFKPSNQICQFTDEQVSTSLYKIQFTDTASKLTNINIRGGAWSAAGAQRYVLNASNTNINSFVINGTQISRLAAGSEFHPTASISNSAFINCLKLNPSTAVFENNSISNSTDTSGALLWPGGSTVKTCAFLDNSRAIEITQTINQVFDALTFSGNTSDVHLNNTGVSIDISKNNGSNPTTYVATGGGVVTFVGAAVTFKISATDALGNPIAGARVMIKASSGTGPMPYLDAVTIVNSGTTATVTHTAHGLSSGDMVNIQAASLIANNGVYSATVTDANTYTYTMGSTPGSSPTGAITSTYVALFGVTDGSGQLSGSRVFLTDQPVSGVVRKSSASPFYKTGIVNGTISSLTGLNQSVVMISDE
jgi:hypothetical protein